MSDQRALVTEAEADAIRAAVAAAERESAAEIVPVLVEATDDYELADWKGAALGAVAAALATAVAQRFGSGWGIAAAALALPAVAGAVVGWLAARYLAGLRRALVGRDRLDQRVEERARLAFLEHEVFRTRDRTGILILIALFERRVEILADQGIHAVVPPERWQTIADQAAATVHTGSAGEALRRAVEACGAVLVELGPRRRADDLNELPDAPISGPS
jgi:putative membrane protein